jgi:Transposase, Mutator family
MSKQAATITSLPMAFEMVKAMRADGLEWGEGFRPLGRQMVAAIIEEQMAVGSIAISTCWGRRRTGSGATPLSAPFVDHARRHRAHKIRNILEKIRKADQPAAKRAIHKVMNAPNAPAARAAARRFADRFKHKYPNAVACLRNDLDELLTCFRYRFTDQRKAVRTTNAIERRFREVRRRIPGHNLDGPHPVRSLHPRKQITGRQYPFPPDTEQFTLPLLGHSMRRSGRYQCRGQIYGRHRMPLTGRVDIGFMLGRPANCERK